MTIINVLFSRETPCKMHSVIYFIYKYRLLIVLMPKQLAVIVMKNGSDLRNAYNGIKYSLIVGILNVKL
jgi:hypothetical protein